MTNPLGRLSQSDRELCGAYHGGQFTALCSASSTGILQDQNAVDNLVWELREAIESANSLLETSPSDYDDILQDIEDLEALRDFLTGNTSD